jgi:predicted ABC-type transport system involved in lysophospholipase L1 biosynthesis ATPase subunit
MSRERGEQQMLTLSRVFYGSPKVVLPDEVSAGGLVRKGGLGSYLSIRQSARQNNSR